jgi:hypothetical protein
VSWTRLGPFDIHTEPLKEAFVNVDIVSLIGDLSPVEPCKACQAGDYEACSANFKWSEQDPRYARCGKFEEVWISRLRDHIGHGVDFRTRQPDPNSKTLIFGAKGNFPAGWILGVGQDDVGQYVDIEVGDFWGNDDFWKEKQGPPMRISRPTQTARYYIGAILGVRIHKQTRAQAGLCLVK